MFSFLCLQLIEEVGVLGTEEEIEDEQEETKDGGQFTGFELMEEDNVWLFSRFLFFLTLCPMVI